jgi:hypothetical protein
MGAWQRRIFAATGLSMPHLIENSYQLQYAAVF